MTALTVVYTTDGTDDGFHNLCTQLEEGSCLCTQLMEIDNGSCQCIKLIGTDNLSCLCTQLSGTDNGSCHCMQLRKPIMTLYVSTTK